MITQHLVYSYVNASNYFLLLAYDLV
jgi:hypothetical protein